MQSSTAIAFRALIMLICLVSVPMFAIFGKDLPEVIKGLIDGKKLVFAPTDEASPQSPAPLTSAAPGALAGPGTLAADPMSPAASSVQPAAPISETSARNPFGETVPYRSQPTAVRSESPPPDGAGVMAHGAAPSIYQADVQPPSTADVQPARLELARNDSLSAAGAMGSSTAPGNLAVPSDSVTSSAPADPFARSPYTEQHRTPATAHGFDQHDSAHASPAPPPELLGRSDGALSADSYLPPDALPAVPLDGGPDAPSAMGSLSGAAAAADPSDLSGDERFRWAEMRLRDLGATHYLLETWGPDNRQYRFACKMAIAGNSIANKYFESLGDNPWQAMEGVLKQVEQWRSSSQ